MQVLMVMSCRCECACECMREEEITLQGYGQGDRKMDGNDAGDSTTTSSVETQEPVVTATPPL